MNASCRLVLTRKHNYNDAVGRELINFVFTIFHVTPDFYEIRTRYRTFTWHHSQYVYENQRARLNFSVADRGGNRHLIGTTWGGKGHLDKVRHCS